MDKYRLPSMLSTNFSVTDLLHAGETWGRTRISNCPREPETWKALKKLCEEILEPIQEKFGRPTITYGFACHELTRKIKRGINSPGDQHAGHERNQNGSPICKRLGQSVDFFVPGVSSAQVAGWIVENLPFDRLYFYGIDRPVHVSVGPEKSRYLVAMLPKKGNLVPTKINTDWLRAQRGPE